jgi:hypothetical protein
MIWAYQTNDVARRVAANLRAAVPARVEEGVDPASLVSEDHDRGFTDRVSQVIARIRDLPFNARLEPGALEDRLQVDS